MEGRAGRGDAGMHAAPGEGAAEKKGGNKKKGGRWRRWTKRRRNWLKAGAGEEGGGRGGLQGRAYYPSLR